MTETEYVSTEQVSIHPYIDQFFNAGLQRLEERDYENAKEYGFRAVAASLRIEDQALQQRITELSKHFSTFVDLVRVLHLAARVHQEKSDTDPNAAREYLRKVVAEANVALPGFGDDFKQVFNQSLEGVQAEIEALHDLL